MLIDGRAGSKELLEMPPLTEVAVEAQLEFGDISITGNGPNSQLVAVGVELKSLSDLIQSDSTGRMAAHQLPGMLRDYDQPWLLTYGQYRPGSHYQLEILRGSKFYTLKQGGREMPYSYLESILLTYTAAGIHHKHVATKRDAAAWLYCLHRWWSKDWDKHKGLNKFNRSRDLSIVPDIAPEMLQRMRIAADFPGVGWERAMSAANYFPTIRAMILASEREWMEVDGIGPVLAKSIVRAVS